MQYIAGDLEIGAIDSVPVCSPESNEFDIASKFMLMVLMRGAQHFVIDGIPFELDAGDDENCRPMVVMLNVARQSKLRFLNAGPVPLRKVMITAPRPWLDHLIGTENDESAVTLRKFFSEHLALFSFEPGRNLIAVANKLESPPPTLRGELLSMYVTAQALDIMWQACLTLVAERRGMSNAPSLMGLRQCESVKDFIMDNLQRDLSIGLIAKEVGASTSVVQRHFKEHFGCTIFDFIRQKRLEAAHASLVNEGITASQAAYLAGYNNLSSFTTAFKKAYGITPRKVRS